MKFHGGQQFPSRVFTTVQDEEVAVPDSIDLVHLQFRRFVGCPICNTHIGQLRKRRDEIKAAGIRELIFFHSTSDEIRPYQNDLPFDLVADSKKIIYKDIGAETSLFYFAYPKAIWAALKGMARLRYPLKMTGGPFGLPAEMLIETSGRVKAVKYGRHAYDQWSVDELLSLAASSNPGLETSANQLSRVF